MANTYSTDLERSSEQFWSRQDTNLSAGFPAKNSTGSTGDFSLEGHYKVEQLPTVAGDVFCLINKRTPGNSKGFDWIISSASDVLQILYQETDGGNISLCASNSAIITGGDVGNWVHLAVTVDVSTATAVFYKNKVAVASSCSSSAASFVGLNTDQLTIGTDTTGSGQNYYDGLKNNVRVWSVIRTAQEIEDNADLVLSSGTGLEGSWFNETQDGTDLTSNGNDLTNNNSATFVTDVPFSEVLTLVVDTMAIALTYGDVFLTKGKNLIVDTMAVVSTFFDVNLIAPGLKLVVDTMAISVTFADVLFRRIYKLVADTMAIIATFNPISLIWLRAYTLVVNTMSIAVTFFNVIMRIPGRWNNLSKNISSWTNKPK